MAEKEISLDPRLVGQRLGEMEDSVAAINAFRNSFWEEMKATWRRVFPASGPTQDIRAAADRLFAQIDADLNTCIVNYDNCAEFYAGFVDGLGKTELQLLERISAAGA